MKRKLSVILTIFVLFIAVGLPLHAQEKKVVLATDNWEPYYGAQLKEQGFITQITREAFKRAGYDLQVKFIPWKRAMELVKKGKFQGLMGAYRNREREKFFTFSDPMAEIRIVFFMKRGRNIRYEKLKDLAPYKIGIIRGYAYSNEFDTAQYLKKEVVDNMEVNIKKLLKGRNDLIVGSRIVIMDIIQKKFPRRKGELVALEPSLKESSLHIAFSKRVPGHEALAEDFNRGLKSLREDGAMARIMKFHEFE